MINFEKIACKPTELLSMTGYTLDEFNALLRSFEEALLESNQTLEGKERVNKPSIYKNSPFSSIADQLFLGAFPFSRFKKNLSFDAKIVVCFASQLSILSIINRCGANGMETQKAKDCKTVDEVYACLKELEEDKKMIHGPEELDQIEQAIISYTNRLAALLIKKKSKQS